MEKLRTNSARDMVITMLTVSVLHSHYRLPVSSEFDVKLGVAYESCVIFLAVQLSHVSSVYPDYDTKTDAAFLYASAASGLTWCTKRKSGPVLVKESTARAYPQFHARICLSRPAASAAAVRDPQPVLPPVSRVTKTAGWLQQSSALNRGKPMYTLTETDLRAATL